ncbi:MAG: hypothetical protein NT045_04705 [Candidatus Aureabacteria bacterium]|nr:hypothetical protein [Candidatus Auribacterota bacterium]
MNQIRCILVLCVLLPLAACEKPSSDEVPAERKAAGNTAGRLNDSPAAQSPSPVPAGRAFIGNKGSRKIHRADCTWGQKISPGKRIYFSTYEEAKAAGYVPCRTCNPDLPPKTPVPLGDNDYCASRTGNFFHKGKCDWARKISQEHLVVYKSREEAIAAGKTPCTICNP